MCTNPKEPENWHSLVPRRYETDNPQWLPPQACSELLHWHLNRFVLPGVQFLSQIRIVLITSSDVVLRA